MKLRIQETVITLLVLAATSFGSPSKPSLLSTKQEDIRNLLKVTETRELAMQIMTHKISSFRESMSDVPDTIWTLLIAEMDPDELVTLCIPAYENNFSHDEIRQLLAFYQSPLGKLLLEKQPMIIQECINVGEQWAQMANQRFSANPKELYGQDDTARNLEFSAPDLSQVGNDYFNQLLTMISTTEDEMTCNAFKSSQIDPSGKMCGLTFGMSIDQVIAVWGKPTGLSFNTIHRLPEQVLHYRASSLHFKHNKLTELDFHNNNFPDVTIWEGLTFGMNPEQVAAACSNLTSETKGNRIYYDVADGVTMKPHFYQTSKEPEPLLISIELSRKNAETQSSPHRMRPESFKTQSNPIGLSNILGKHKIIACITSNEGKDARIPDKELKNSTLNISTNQITAENLLGKKLIHIKDEPAIDSSISTDDFIVGYFNGNEDDMFFVQPEEIEINGKKKTAICFSCDLNDQSLINIWVE
ncbi:DUF2059 domain-containing protein [Pontiellaceae bacterium B12227]|nr:DUF2059 domain-containing protein [Pontiellaceae bacterium B12227]